MFELFGDKKELKKIERELHELNRTERKEERTLEKIEELLEQQKLPTALNISQIQ